MACATAFIWTQHLNEGSYKIVGKSATSPMFAPPAAVLNESPFEKEGKSPDEEEERRGECMPQ